MCYKGVVNGLPAGHQSMENENVRFLGKSAIYFHLFLIWTGFKLALQKVETSTRIDKSIDGTVKRDCLLKTSNEEEGV